MLLGLGGANSMLLNAAVCRPTDTVEHVVVLQLRSCSSHHLWTIRFR